MATIDKIFSQCDFSTRLHVRLRILTVPCAALNRYLPRNGSFLDLGGGHGALAWYLHFKSPQRKFSVFDFDESKISNGRKAGLIAGKSEVTYHQKDIRRLAAEDFHGFSDILLADVLYLLTDKDRFKLLSDLHQGLLENSGTLWIKDVAEVQGLKSLWDKAQEALIQTIGWTKTDGISRTISRETLLHDLKRAGFSAEFFWIDQGYPHAHILYRATPILRMSLAD